MISMTDPAIEYDVFISYAREDSDWVREHLYARLLACQFHDGRRPRIFFDVGEEGIQIGQSFPIAIANAIQRSARIVPVYSTTYFRKEMCLFELEKASQLDPRGSAGKLAPILIAEQGTPEIPFLVNHINYYTTAAGDWFERLCKALGVTRTLDKYALEFLEQPLNVFVNHTLPVVKVAIRGAKGEHGPAEAITLANPAGSLHGTTTRIAQQGVALFDDLSIGEASADARLIARCPALEAVVSQPFTVHAVTAPPPRQSTPAHREIPASGEVLFFEQAPAVAVLSPDRVATYSLDGQPLSTLGSLPLPQRLRVVRRGGSLIALGDWSGNVHLLGQCGRQRSVSFGTRDAGFTVPADIDIVDDAAYVAFWNGSVFRLEMEGPPERVALCNEGAQALAVAGDRVLLVDFAGLLRIYRDGRLVNTHPLDPTIWMLRAYSEAIIAVSDSRCYRIITEGMRSMGFDMPVESVVHIDENTHCPTVLGPDGKGFRMTADLVFSSFHTHPGAVPVSSDDAGLYSVLAHADGSRTLLVKDRIVFTHPQGAMAVSPRGDWMALGEPEGIRIFDVPAFLKMVYRGAASA